MNVTRAKVTAVNRNCIFVQAVTLVSEDERDPARNRFMMLTLNVCPKTGIGLWCWAAVAAVAAAAAAAAAVAVISIKFLVGYLKITKNAYAWCSHVAITSIFIHNYPCLLSPHFTLTFWCAGLVIVGEVISSWAHLATKLQSCKPVSTKMRG